MAKQPKPAEMLDDRSLVKWETSDPKSSRGQAVLRIARELIHIANGGKAPAVLDPFAGGGAIPLEAGPLGCQAIANGCNPVAYLILRATCEFPQKYGRPGQRPKSQVDFINGEPSDQPELTFAPDSESDEMVEVENVFAHDVEFWAKWVTDCTRERIGHFYPRGEDEHPAVGYLWGRTAPCANPSCGKTMPLRKSLLIRSKSGKRVALRMAVNENDASFGIARDRAIGATEGTVLRGGDCRCPFCGQTTPVERIRQAGFDGKLCERMTAVITDTPNGNDYRPVEAVDLAAICAGHSRAQETHCVRLTKRIAFC